MMLNHGVFIAILYHILCYRYLRANDSKVAQLGKMIEKLDNLKITIHKDTKINMMAIMHVRNGIFYLELSLVPK